MPPDPPVGALPQTPCAGANTSSGVPPSINSSIRHWIVPHIVTTWPMPHTRTRQTIVVDQKTLNELDEITNPTLKERIEIAITYIEFGGRSANSLFIVCLGTRPFFLFSCFDSMSSQTFHEFSNTMFVSVGNAKQAERVRSVCRVIRFVPIFCPDSSFVSYYSFLFSFYCFFHVSSFCVVVTMFSL